ncbi:MAG: branched-chain amino acid transaminase [Solirubrobacterales bacterium]|nr:branched-chain amino acid transaminase [Solirubrobacterales bacterium]
MSLAWVDGEIMPAQEATVPLLCHGLHYGTAVFEGIRAYATPRGPALFRLDDHLDRLLDSATLYALEIPYSRDELRAATHELVARSGLASCYVRPIAFPVSADGTMRVCPLGASTTVAIAVWEWGAYLGEAGKRDGIRAKVSSWQRISEESLLPAAKAAGHYLNSVLASVEAQRAGYEEAILLDSTGHVSEGAAENVFVVRDGRIATPTLCNAILDGITRQSTIAIARDLGLEVAERNVGRHELYIADEVFVTGTAAELTPVREVDDRVVGDGRPGPVTLRLQSALDDALHGRTERWAHWSEPVAAGALEVPAP